MPSHALLFGHLPICKLFLLLWMCKVFKVLIVGAYVHVIYTACNVQSLSFNLYCAALFITVNKVTKH